MPGANDSSRCHTCGRLCSEIQALAEVASEFIAVDRLKDGAASFARMELMVVEYKRHIHQKHRLRSGAAATFIR
ncbi:MAG TPA: hypothetical protein VFA04_20035 [Bryobacteraceae bacterium]|nr:hypothetical protein [Bryobacteraceae bacterium]